MTNVQVICYITPNELRSYANILENKWKNVCLGDKVPEISIIHENAFKNFSTEVILRIDQEKMNE